MTKAFAFYFPQFCQEPLNDAGWYPGFTDWDLIKNVLIRQPTTYRDFAPADGFYCQESPSVVSAQVRAAKALGLHGFCAYHYWFDGEQALGLPVELLRTAVAELDFEYFLCWANEPWTKRWAGRDEIIITPQAYSPTLERIQEHVTLLRSHFTAKGYLHIDGRPVFAIYNPDSPGLLAVLSQYIKSFQTHGLNPYLVAMETEFIQLHKYDFFDMSVRFEPRAYFSYMRQKHGKHLYWGVRSLANRFPALAKLLVSHLVDKSRRYSYSTYSEYVHVSLQNLTHRICTGETVSTSFIAHWDNTPRYLDRSTYFTGVTEHLVDSTFRRVANWAEDHQMPFFLINAWNEWTEGATLERRIHQDFDFGEVVKRGLIRNNSAPLSGAFPPAGKLSSPTKAEEDLSTIG